MGVDNAVGDGGVEIVDEMSQTAVTVAVGFFSITASMWWRSTWRMVNRQLDEGSGRPGRGR
jgi:hypothetical protein